MIVADASALLLLLDRGQGAAELEVRLFAGDGAVCVPHLVDAQVAHVLSRCVLTKKIGEARAEEALRDFLDLPLLRFAHPPLLPRAFSLRHTMTAYDALYVALAESLGATLVTRDAKLARAADGVCAVEGL